MRENIEKVLLTEEEIQNKVSQLAQLLNEEYADKNPVFIGVLKGVVVFFGDMMKHLSIPCQIDFMWVSSYEGTNSAQLRVKRDITTDIKGRHVVILEDIYDTGNSLQFVNQHLWSKEPASVEICTLLDKPARRNPNVTLKPKYTGFTIPNEFVVGYGLDFDEYYRNLPYIGILKPEAYQ